MDASTILAEIRVATPCRANWDEMPGDDRVRSCPTCSRSVYNIAAMTSAEATSLIAGREGRLCARLYRRADGTLVTADCPPPAPPRPRRVRAAVIVLVALSLSWLGSRPGESPPSGQGVTWDDWVHWASVSLGLLPAPIPAPTLRRGVTMGDVY
jgi:hypothetical protein